MKIKIVMNELYLGGVEKSLLSFLKENKEIKFDLFLPKHGRNIQINQIPENTKIFYYQQKDSLLTKLFYSLKLLFLRISETEDYDVTIDYCGISPITNFHTLKSKNKKYFFIHSDLYTYSRNSSLFIKLQFLIFKLIFKKHLLKNNFIFVSNSVHTQFEKFIGATVMGTTINNYVPFINIPINYSKKSELIRILFVGRLSKEKNIPLLLETMFELKKITLNFQLKIVGDGAEKEFAKKYIKENNLSKEVLLLGRQENVQDFYLNSDVLFSPSYNEGQGLVLFEANQCNLPVIGCENITYKEFLSSDIGVLVPFDSKVIAKVIAYDLESIKAQIKPIDLRVYNENVKKCWLEILKVH